MRQYSPPLRGAGSSWRMMLTYDGREGKVRLLFGNKRLRTNNRSLLLTARSLLIFVRSLLLNARSLLFQVQKVQKVQPVFVLLYS